jgi:hypothetical protein
MRIAEGKGSEPTFAIDDANRRCRSLLFIGVRLLASLPYTKNGGVPYAFCLEFARHSARAVLGYQSGGKKVKDSPSFQRRIEHCSYIVDLHLWQRGDHSAFATFVYEKAGERLLRHFANTDETEVIRKALVWCERHSHTSQPHFFPSVSQP